MYKLLVKRTLEEALTYHILGNWQGKGTVHAYYAKKAFALCCPTSEGRPRIYRISLMWDNSTLHLHGHTFAVQLP